MYKVYNTNHKFIVYNRNQNNRKSNICVIFLHGLLSDMTGTKALYLEKYCMQMQYDFIRFDNFGHGTSSGIFTDETIGSWFEGLMLIINNLVQNQQIILIGSSMGGWVSLLAAIKYPEKIAGLIGIAPAPDFTENLLWQKLPPLKQQELKEKGLLELHGNNNEYKYPISYNLITEARNHLLLNQVKIDISCPVHLIHGLQDVDVPYSVSEKLFSKISSTNLILKLIKDADHKLSRDSDLKIIANSLEEIVSCL